MLWNTGCIWSGTTWLGIQAVYSILFGNKGCICQILLGNTGCVCHILLRNTDCIWTEEHGVYLLQNIAVELLWMLDVQSNTIR